MLPVWLVYSAAMESILRPKQLPTVTVAAPFLPGVVPMQLLESVDGVGQSCMPCVGQPAGGGAACRSALEGALGGERGGGEGGGFATGCGGGLRDCVGGGLSGTTGGGD